MFRALHQNSLHGPIPSEIKNCTELRAMYVCCYDLVLVWFHLHLSANDFVELKCGGLIYSVCVCSYLRANYLQGGIPSEIGELIHLTIL